MKKKRYSYSFYKKVIFYIFFFLNKRFIFTECKRGKIKLFFAEIIWLVGNTIRLDMVNLTLPKFISDSYFETTWGKFFIHPDVMSTMIISPTLERSDRDKLLQMIKKDLQERRKVLFIDVGAHVGDYAIGLGNKLKGYKNFFIIAFEPNATNFRIKTLSLLKQNVKINNIKRIKIFPVGLGSVNSDKANVYGIKTKKLDNILGEEYSKKFDAIYIKIDIEGFETDALIGSEGFVKNAKKVVFLIEDCVDTKVINYLSDKYFFIDKISPYNSFWEK